MDMRLDNSVETRAKRAVAIRTIQQPQLCWLATCITISHLTDRLTEVCISASTLKSLTERVASQQATPAGNLEFQALIRHINLQHRTYIQVHDAKRRIESEQILTDKGRHLLSSSIFSTDALLNEYTSFETSAAGQKRRNKHVVDFLLKIMTMKDERENVAAFKGLPFASPEEETPPAAPLEQDKVVTVGRPAEGLNHGLSALQQIATASSVIPGPNQEVSGSQQQTAVAASASATPEENHVPTPAQEAEGQPTFTGLLHGQERLSSQQQGEVVFFNFSDPNQQAPHLNLWDRGQAKSFPLHGVQALPFRTESQNHGLLFGFPPSPAPPVTFWEEYRALQTPHQEAEMPNLIQAAPEQHQQPSAAHQEADIQTPFRPWPNPEGGAPPDQDDNAMGSGVSCLDEMEPRPLPFWDPDEEMREPLLAFNDEWKAEDNWS